MIFEYAVGGEDMEVAASCTTGVLETRNAEMQETGRIFHRFDLNMTIDDTHARKENALCASF
jgi:hypothetical protein